MIAVGQLGMAILLTRSGRLLGLGVIGGVLFLVAILPLGIGSAFPASLTMAVALGMMHRRLGRRET